MSGAVTPTLKAIPGDRRTLGAIPGEDGVNFAVASSLAEEVTLPDLGRELLTPELRQRLADYPDEELFSNQVRFVLRPRATQTHPA